MSFCFLIYRNSGEYFSDDDFWDIVWASISEIARVEVRLLSKFFKCCIFVLLFCPKFWNNVTYLTHRCFDVKPEEKFRQKDHLFDDGNRQALALNKRIWYELSVSGRRSISPCNFPVSCGSHYCTGLTFGFGIYRGFRYGSIRCAVNISSLNFIKGCSVALKSTL